MKKRFMRSLAAMLVLLMVFALAACGEKTPAPSEADESVTTLPGGGTQAAAVENKVNLSLDKTKYSREERIEVTLDFGKLNKDDAVIVIANSDLAHGKETAVHADDKHEEYRWISDFSEIPFYMWAPDKDGLFDVRVYANGDGGEELASVTFSAGNAALPQSAVNNPTDGGGSQQGESKGWPSISYLKATDKYAGDGNIAQVHEWGASGENGMWTIYYNGATFESVESYVADLVSAGWVNHYADDDGNYMEEKTEKGTARAYYCTCDYAEVEIEVADFSNTNNFSGEEAFSFNLSIQFSKA